MRLDFSDNGPVVASIMVAALLLFLGYLPDEALRNFASGEGSPAETATAILYAAAAVVALHAAARAVGWQRAYLLLWGLLSMVLFGEETSWLQHQIGYATPEWLAAHNVQGEVNLHNLRGLHGGKLLEYEAHSPLLGKLLGAQNLFQAGLVGYFLVLPLLATVPLVFRLLQKIDMPLAGPRLILFIWIPIGSAILLAFILEGSAKSAAAELREMFYAVAIATFVILLARWR